MVAVVADQAGWPPVMGQRDVAAGAVAHGAAVATLQVCGEAAPVEQQDRLLFALQALVHRRAQGIGKDERAGWTAVALRSPLAPLLAQVDQPDGGQRPGTDPLWKLEDLPIA